MNHFDALPRTLRGWFDALKSFLRRPAPSAGAQTAGADAPSLSQQSDATAQTGAFWRDIEAQLPEFAWLTDAQRQRLRALAEAFLRRKRFWGAHGFEVTPEVAGLIAYHAALIAHRAGLFIYDGFAGVIVYPGAFVRQRRLEDEWGVVHEWEDELSGETWEQGPVVLAWHEARDATMNTFLHEFAHRFDAASGAIDGCPPLPPEISPRAWQRVWSRALARAEEEAKHGLALPFDEYALAGPEEFFAVLTESFFLHGEALQTWDDAVYSHLVALYGLDPVQQRVQRSKEPRE